MRETSSGLRAEQRVFLTFDDGPDPDWTPRVLDVLAAAEAKATFFVVGCRLRARPDIARRLLREGHAIGNHTFQHRHPWALTRRAACAEVRDGAAVIADVTGSAPTWFRPPYGRVRRCMNDEAQLLGQTLVLWNRSAVDWGPFATAPRIARRLAGVQAGDILLMHDAAARRNAPGILLRVLPRLLLSLAATPLTCTPLISGRL